MNRLNPRARKTILALHVSTSVALIGMTASVLILALRAAGSDRASDAHALYAAIETLAFALAIPFSLASLTTGIALGLGSNWGILRHRWVAAKLGLQLAIIAGGALVVGPRTQGLIDATALQATHSPPDLGSARWQVPIVGAANLVFAVTAVSLAVFKPRGLLCSSRASADRPRATR